MIIIQESPYYWLDTAEAEGEIIHNDDKKTVYRGVHTGRTALSFKEELPYDSDVIRKRLRKRVDYYRIS